MTLHSFHWPYHFIHITLLVLIQPQFHPTWYFPFFIWPSYLCTCSSIPESDLWSELVVYNLLYFTYAPQFIYQLSLPSSRLKFPFVISVSSHYPLNLCCSEIKHTTSARVQHISLCQVLTKSPSPLSSIRPPVQFILTFYPLDLHQTWAQRTQTWHCDLTSSHFSLYPPSPKCWDYHQWMDSRTGHDSSNHLVIMRMKEWVSSKMLPGWRGETLQKSLSLYFEFLTF